MSQEVINLIQQLRTKVNELEYHPDGMTMYNRVVEVDRVMFQLLAAAWEPEPTTKKPIHDLLEELGL